MLLLHINAYLMHSIPVCIHSQELVRLLIYSTKSSPYSRWIVSLAWLLQSFMSNHLNAVIWWLSQSCCSSIANYTTMKLLWGILKPQCQSKLEHINPNLQRKGSSHAKLKTHTQVILGGKSEEQLKIKGVWVRDREAIQFSSHFNEI